jgi:flagellar motor switch protein FliG
MIVLVTMQAKIGDAEGMINFCIPYLTIEPVIPKLSARSVYSSLRRRVPHLGLSAAALPVTAEVFFDGDRVSLSTLQNLKKGALIGIPGYGAGNAFLQAGGARFLRLHAQRAREARGAYALAESQVAKDLVTLGAAGRPSGEAEAEAAQEALHSLSADIASTVKSLKGNIQELAKKQEELADQLIFQSPDQDLVPGDRGEKKHGPFGFITMAACETLATFLGQEHPQLIALVLSYLDPGLAACVLGKIPPGMQTDIAERICSIERTAPEVLRDVERVLEHKLSALSSKDLILAGGVESMVEILNAAPRGIEKNIVESLEKANRALAEEVKKRMFVFEDIVVLDRASVAKVLTETPADDLVLALKATDQKVRDLVWDCMAPSDAESLKARLESVGRARLTDVEAAQQRIVGVIRRMEEEGKIVVGRAGEMTS